MAAAEEITILVLPGLDGTGDLLTNFRDRLLEDWTVQVIGYPVEISHGYDDLVTYASKFLSGKKVVLVAESFSGPIAIEIAAKDARVVGVVLASSFARRPVPSWLVRYASAVPLTLVPAGIVCSLLLGAASTRELRERVRRVLNRLHPVVVRTRMSAIAGVDKLDRVGELRCPVLLLRGRQDRLVGRRSAEEIRSRQPTCSAVCLDGPHMLLETRARECADAVTRFCRRFI